MTFINELLNAVSKINKGGWLDHVPIHSTHFAFVLFFFPGIASVSDDFGLNIKLIQNQCLHSNGTLIATNNRHVTIHDDYIE